MESDISWLRSCFGFFPYFPHFPHELCPTCSFPFPGEKGRRYHCLMTWFCDSSGNAWLGDIGECVLVLYVSHTTMWKWSLWLSCSPCAICGSKRPGGCCGLASLWFMHAINSTEWEGGLGTRGSLTLVISVLACVTLNASKETSRSQLNAVWVDDLRCWLVHR